MKGEKDMSRNNKNKYDSPIKAVYIINQLYEYIDTMVPYLNKKHEEFNMNLSVQTCISELIIYTNNLHDLINIMDNDKNKILDRFTSVDEYLTLVEVHCATLVERGYITTDQGFYIGGMIYDLRNALQNWKSYINKHGK